jgi:outer membrane protein assembly factor BamA
LNLQLRNLRGRAETLDLSGRIGALHGAWLHWQNPSILGPAAIALFGETSWHRHDFSYEDFRLRNAYGRIGISRAIARWARARLSYTLREVGFDEVSTGFEAGTARDDAIEFSLEHDSRDIRYYPTKGVYAEAAVRFSSIAQQRPYQIYRLHAAAFANLPWIDVIGGHIGYRFGGQRLPVYERGQLGGPGDLRAAEFGALDGDATILAAIEIRRPLFLLPLRDGRAVGLGLHAFHDWGKAFDHGAGFDSAPVWRGFGAGLHVNLNTLNLRFEWAQDEAGENRFVFEDSFTF